MHRRGRAEDWIKAVFGVALHFFIFHTTHSEEIQLLLSQLFFLASEGRRGKGKKKSDSVLKVKEFTDG